MLVERLVPSVKTGGVNTHIRNTAFQEVSPATWLSTEAVIQHFSEEGRAGGILKMKVTHQAINNIGDDAFEINPPEGMLVYNKDKKEQWRYSKPGKDPFNRSLHKAG